MVTSRTIVMLPSAALSTTGTTNPIVVPHQYSAVQFWLDCSAYNASASSPTLNVRIQNGMRAQGSTTVVGGPALGDYEWDDYAAFAQLTSTGERKIRVVSSGEEEHAVANGTLTAGSIRNGPIGGAMRVQYGLGGTGPSFTASVIAEFLP